LEDAALDSAAEEFKMYMLRSKGRYNALQPDLEDHYIAWASSGQSSRASLVIPDKIKNYAYVSLYRKLCTTPFAKFRTRRWEVSLTREQMKTSDRYCVASIPNRMDATVSRKGYGEIMKIIHVSVNNKAYTLAGLIQLECNYPTRHVYPVQDDIYVGYPLVYMPPGYRDKELVFVPVARLKRLSILTVPGVESLSLAAQADWQHHFCAVEIDTFFDDFF
jgi:hypothetical protein